MRKFTYTIAAVFVSVCILYGHYLAYVHHYMPIQLLVFYHAVSIALVRKCTHHFEGLQFP